MKVATVQKIDEVEFITGFCDLTIDAQETKKVIVPHIEATQEFKDSEAKMKQISEATAKMDMAKKDIKIATATLGSSTATTEDKAQALQNKEQALISIGVQEETIKNLQQALIIIIEGLNNRTKQIYAQYAVNFEPGRNERAVENSQLGDLVEKFSNLDKSKKEFLKLSGDVIQDKRGTLYFEKSGERWNQGKVVKITDVVPGTAKIESALTDTERTEIVEQAKTDRIDGLTAEEKTAEKESVLAGLVQQAGAMKNELEITGDPDPLATAQAWYNAEVAKVEDMYA
jgi:hypothetical protein